jgi:EpsI family protein
MNEDGSPRLFSGRFALTATILAACLGAVSMTTVADGNSLVQPLTCMPTLIAGWESAGDDPLPSDMLEKLRATSYLSRSYRKNARLIELFLAHYGKQEAGSAMHSPTNCLAGSGWEIWRRDVARLAVRGREFEVNNLLIRNAEASLVVLYWYQSPNRITANEYMQKLFLFRDTLLEGRRSESLVRIALPESQDAVQEGRDFGAAAAGALWECMGAR